MCSSTPASPAALERAYSLSDSAAAPMADAAGFEQMMLKGRAYVAGRAVTRA